MRQWLVRQTSGGEKRKEAGDETENINNNACKTKKTGREWLVFDHENVVMFCKDCCMYAKEKKQTNDFMVGPNHFKVEAVKDHEKKFG